MSLVPTSLFRHLGLRPSEAVAMPTRVRALVTAEEERSERLISWVQLAIVAVFGTLYSLSPRPADAGDGLEPVPVVLALYAAFTVLRLAAAYRGYLPGWLLVLSMLADIALLYALIWSFHIAYDQPAPFYLKVPTFAYVFVFIAIRALRFDPRFVISQGVFAALGWTGMLIYAVADAGTGSVTRSFVAYLNGNLVLVGAELDKVFTVVLVTAVLALALARARRTLLAAATEGAASREMRRYFGAGVADAITSREQAAIAGEAEGRDAAILMLDLRNFSRFAEAVSPSAVVDALTDYHRLAIPIIESHGGVVDKFLGDGVMATFGAVKPSGTPAADALAALCRIMDAAPMWADRLSARGHPALPINGAAVAGRVVAATVGTDQRLEFTVIGSPANLAAKLEKHNKDCGTAALTTEATFDLACEQGFLRARTPPRAVQGRGRRGGAAARSARITRCCDPYEAAERRRDLAPPARGRWRRPAGRRRPLRRRRSSEITMGYLLDGQWHTGSPGWASEGGEFERKASSFRSWVTADGAAGPSGEGGFRAEAGRYHLTVSLACPWAHRTLIMRRRKGLEERSACQSSTGTWARTAGRSRTAPGSSPTR